MSKKPFLPTDPENAQERLMGQFIKVKNGDLYRAWIAYLCCIEGKENSTPQIRTQAFVASQRAQPIPLS
jgi:hypothetical protein